MLRGHAVDMAAKYSVNARIFFRRRNGWIVAEIQLFAHEHHEFPSVGRSQIDVQIAAENDKS